MLIYVRYSTVYSKWRVECRIPEYDETYSKMYDTYDECIETIIRFVTMKCVKMVLVEDKLIWKVGD